MTRNPASTVIVTGASKGIGLAASQALADQGYHVVGLARTRPDSFPGEFLPVDLGDEAATRAAASTIAERGPVYGIVNNVGAVRAESLAEVSMDAFHAIMDITVRPAVTLTQALLPGMKEQGRGRIVNISSLTTLGFPNRSSYAASKAAMVTLTRVWALELATSGITVNAVAPGPTETALFRANNPPGSPGEAAYLSLIPMGRVGRPEEIGGVIAFLMSDAAGYMTGQTLYVDGGASVGKAAT